MSDRTFSVDEANAELPRLQAALPRIREARQTILAHGELIRRTARRDGGGAEGAAYLEAARTLRREVERLTADGIVLRDAESGLVDFPAEREGQEMFLCWKLGEDRVAFWHPPDTGFAGRRPL